MCRLIVIHYFTVDYTGYNLSTLSNIKERENIQTWHNKPKLAWKASAMFDQLISKQEVCKKCSLFCWKIQMLLYLFRSEVWRHKCPFALSTLSWLLIITCSNLRTTMDPSQWSWHILATSRMSHGLMASSKQHRDIRHAPTAILMRSLLKFNIIAKNPSGRPNITHFA